MSVVYERWGVTVHHGDCLDILAELPDASVHAVVTDPPYNLSFMAKPWDVYAGREDAGFCYWLAGLIDGEGCFTIKAHTRGTHAPMFRLKLRADERGVLQRIQRTVGVGTLSEHPARDGSSPQVSWDVQDKAGCQRLVDLLDKYPLRAKKLVDYWAWREAVCEWTSRPRGNRWHGKADNTRMAALRSRLVDTRTYTDTPWSGHEFQDWCRLWAAECLRVLKPGGHMLAFGGTRTWHRLACAVEDAGFELRDSIAWLYGTGFPKSMDVSKAIDKARDDRADIVRVTGWLAEQRDRSGLTNRDLDAAFDTNGMAGHWTSVKSQPAVPTWGQWQKLRELVGFGDDMDAEVWRLNGRKGTPGHERADRVVSAKEQRIYGEGRSVLHAGTPVLDEAALWDGWGTALKPAFEPIVVGRKPLSSTVAATVLEHDTGALNIDACRIASGQDYRDKCASVVGLDSDRNGDAYGEWTGARADSSHEAGRWPTNVVLTHAALLDESGEPVGDACSDGCVDGCPVLELDRQSGMSTSRAGMPRGAAKGDGWGMTATGAEYDDEGGASRFFPVFRWEAKAPTSERPRVRVASKPVLRLRSDLTEQEQAYVLAELKKAGVDVA